MSVNTQKIGFNLLAALLVATVIVAAVLVVDRKPRQYEARGVFYFGPYGNEKESLLIEDWSGPDRLCMFMEQLWECRPDDFMRQVIRRLHDEYGWVGNEDVAMKAVNSIEFHRCANALAMIELSVVSSGPSLAADVANASMDVIGDFEVAQEERRRSKVVDAFDKECRYINEEMKNAKERLNHAQSDEDKRRLAQDIAQLERVVSEYMTKFAAYKTMDVRTNTMFKVMSRAEAGQ